MHDAPLPTTYQTLKQAWNYIQSGEDWRVNVVLGSTLVAVVAIWVLVLRAESISKRNIIDLDAPMQCGEITAEYLRRFDGSDPFSPIYLAVNGRVYDVTKGRDFYGPGGAYNMFAGRECARALAAMSKDEKDLTDNLVGLKEDQLTTLKEWEHKFEQKYGIVGTVVPPKQLTLQELHAHDGSQPDKPLYLAILGVIYDVSKGKDYYGPDGMYPFAGRECARALAKFSTEAADCTDDLEGLGVGEKDQLDNWIQRFQYKYPIVGRIVKQT